MLRRDLYIHLVNILVGPKNNYYTLVYNFDVNLRAEIHHEIPPQDPGDPVHLLVHAVVKID